MNVAVDVLLAVAVAGEVVAVLGVVVMRTTFDRLHYVSAGAAVPPFLVLAALLIREHLSASGLEAIVAVVLPFLVGPVLVHATARAARRIDYASVRPLPEEKGPPTS